MPHARLENAVETQMVVTARTSQKLGWVMKATFRDASQALALFAESVHK